MQIIERVLKALLNRLRRRNDTETKDFSESSASVDLSYAFGLPPEKAIEYFKSKGYAFTWDWYDMWQEAHAKAFTVAKIGRMDILQDIRDALQKALDEGTTFQQFKKDLTPTLQAKGWWGRQMIMDETGAAGEVQLGSPWRLKTIYETNLQIAYGVGRDKEMMENNDDRPYRQWVAVLDRKTRRSHMAMNGKVFRHDDLPVPFLPCDWGCRCHWRALSEANLTKRNLTVESAKENRTTEERPIGQTGNKAEVTVYTDPVTGAKVSTGIGWNYNPGEVAYKPDLRKYDKDIAKLYD